MIKPSNTIKILQNLHLSLLGLFSSTKLDCCEDSERDREEEEEEEEEEESWRRRRRRKVYSKLMQ